MPYQGPTDDSCLTRLFDACREPLGVWIREEVRIKTPIHDVLRSLAAFPAYMIADLLKQTMKQKAPYDLVATINLWFLDSLRIGLTTDTVKGKVNGNGVEP